ncbi:NnrU family protein [Oceanobacter mangrovi]|uniref:NnrU family protein n=1 Tax=Oceanobacter mangrovi TaxID=2862510 RepID=UPI001C8E4BE2|nr:NnrU family protein [Oceanobacter mangrovi]
MTLLIIGLIIFIGVHSIVLAAPGWREQTIQKLGKASYQAVHGVLALVSLLLIIKGYGDARMSPTWLWIAPVWTRHIAALFTLMAFIVLASAYIPGTWIKAKTGHPLLAAIKAWAFAHLLANGGLHDVLLFGSILAWSIVAYIVHRKRDRKNGVTYQHQGIARDLIALVAGLVSWAAVAFWLHGMLIGIAPFGV